MNLLESHRWKFRVALLLGLMIQSAQLIGAKEETIRVLHHKTGSNGSWFDLVDSGERPTGDKVIIDGFFVDESEKNEVLTLRVESLNRSVRNPEGGEDVPIYRVVARTNRPDAPEPTMPDESQVPDIEMTTVQGVSMPAMIAEAISGAPKAELTKRQASIQALLVVNLAGGQTAGATSKLNLTAIPTTNQGENSSLRFNQKVGPEMAKALSEVVRFGRIQYGGWPYGHQIEIAFEEKYAPKDGPSAAVACALLLDSMITGHVLEPKFAVTGDLNADGSVQPIGGVSAKIRAAGKGGAKRVAIPLKNAGAVHDLAVIEGFAPLLSVPVFTIATFGEARETASADPNPKLDRALSEFEKVRILYQKNPTGFYQTVKHPAVVKKLGEIKEAAPNLLSASLLHQIATGGFESKLTLEGSLSWIDNQTSDVLSGIRSSANAGNTLFEGDDLADAIRELQKMRTRIDARCTAYLDSIINFGTLIRGYISRPPAKGNSSRRAVEQVNQAGARIDAERVKLLRDADIVSELLE